MKIDPDTGLPQLPVDYFWRVTEPTYPYSDYYHVELHREKARRGFWGRISRGSEFIGSHPVRRSDIGPTAILRAAAYAIENDYRILRHFERLAPIRTEFLGDYPPKRLSNDSQ